MENLDDMIKRYTEELERTGQLYGGEEEKPLELPFTKENETASQETASNSDNTVKAENEPETTEKRAENNSSEEGEAIGADSYYEAEDKKADENEPDSTASFSAAVFTGEGAYPVERARVVIYRGDEIYAFLETDRDGATKKATLPAFSKENSLEAENPDKSIDYFADVFAEGFIAQRELLVSAVGGSEIFLRVLMIPEEERIG